MDRTGVREVFCEKWVTLLRAGPCTRLITDTVYASNESEESAMARAQHDAALPPAPLVAAAC